MEVVFGEIWEIFIFFGSNLFFIYDNFLLNLLVGRVCFMLVSKFMFLCLI